MRKRFVTVAFLGALAFASTNFVGCKDYDDDISKLQQQVDALKSISISDLASQLQSLKDANSNLAVANAKMEAAIAEIKTNIEALKEADKTLTSLVNGKVSQATYQAAIDALNAKCSDLATKVAAISALESAVNDLKANKADKATMDALSAAVEVLKAKDTELATKLAALQSTIDGLNTVLAGKADKATVDALKASIDELKASVAGIDSKISKALEPIQASLTKLQEDIAKKADAATIAADIAKIKTEMTAVTDALKAETAANLATVKSELAGRIAVLETAEKQMTGQIEGLKSSIDGLKDRITRLENQPTTDLTEVKTNIAANKTAIENALSKIGAIEGTITGINSRLDNMGTELSTVNTRISDAVSALSTTLSGQITSLSGQIASLKSQYEQADRELAARIAALEAIDHVKKSDFTDLQGKYASLKTTVGDENGGLIKQLKDLSGTVDGLISEALAATGPGTIDAAITKKINETLENSAVIKAAIETAISSLTARVDKIEAELDAVLQRIQSIVFIPQYKDGNGTAIVPIYTIENKNGTVEMTFRISPAEKAAELAQLGATKPEIFTFFKEDQLTTRATSESAIVATGVKAGTSAGTIVIKAQVSPSLGANTAGSYYPVALKLSTSKNYGTEETPNNKPVNNVTTEYFNVRVKDVTTEFFTPSFAQNILYTDTQEKLVNSFVVNVNYGTGPLTLADCGFTQNLELYAVECAGNWVKVASTAQADKDAIADELTEKGFELVGKTAVKLSSPININNVGNVLKVRLADNAIFGVTGTPSVPKKMFEVTYTVTKSTVGATIDYGTITKALLQSGSSNAFVVNAAGEFVWNNSASNAAQTFTIEAKKGDNFTDNLINGATAAEILDAIKNLSPASVEYKIGNATASATDPRFNFDVTAGRTGEIKVSLPANAPRKTYAMSTIYKTGKYGDIVLKATLKLAYPTAGEMWTHQDIRWTLNGLFDMNYDKPSGSALYKITQDFATGYTFRNTAVRYEFYLVKTIDSNGDGILDSHPVDITLSNTTRPEAAYVSNSVITFTGNYVDLKKVKIGVKVDFGTGMQYDYPAEAFQLNMIYPITDQISSKSNFTYKLSDITNKVPLDISTGVNLSDKAPFKTQVVKDGVIQDYGKIAYGMLPVAAESRAGYEIFLGGASSGKAYVSYKVWDGEVVGSTGQILSAKDCISIENGKFKVDNTKVNITREVRFKVQALVKYTYSDKIESDIFIITIDPAN